MEDGLHDYFAYGADIDPVLMAKRCPGAKDRRSAYLADHRLLFHKAAVKRDGTGLPSIDKAPGPRVEGALYTITETDLLRLDRFTGHPAHHTRRIIAVVERDGSHVPAWVYTAKPEWVDEGLVPNNLVVAHIMQGKDVLSAPYRAALAECVAGGRSDVAVAP